METWFLYWLLSVLFTGFFSFSSKISVEKNQNPDLVIFYSMASATFFWILFFLITKWVSQNLFLEFFLWASNWFLYLIATSTRMTSLKYIDTSIYFPIYKSIWPIFLIFITFLFFEETFSSKEIFWIILWIFVPLLLIWKKWKNKNMKKWLFYMFIWVITAISAGLIIKIASNKDVNILLYSIFSLWTWAVWAFLLFLKNNKKNKKYNIVKIKRIWIFTWLLNFLWTYFFIFAVDLSNNLWLVYLLHSLYIVIPIILSVIIYKEHFNFRKLIAIFLTVISVYFLK